MNMAMFVASLTKEEKDELKHLLDNEVRCLTEEERKMRKIDGILAYRTRTGCSLVQAKHQYEREIP